MLRDHAKKTLRERRCRALAEVVEAAKRDSLATLREAAVTFAIDPRRIFRMKNMEEFTRYDDFNWRYGDEVTELFNEGDRILQEGVEPELVVWLDDGEIALYLTKSSKGSGILEGICGSEERWAEPLMHMAAVSCSRQVLKELLTKHSMDPEMLLEVESSGMMWGGTALQRLAQLSGLGDAGVETAEMLVDAGARPLMAGHVGVPLLQLAVRCGYYALAQRALTCWGVDPDERGGGSFIACGWTALNFATLTLHERECALLLEKGASPAIGPAFEEGCLMDDSHPLMLCCAAALACRFEPIDIPLEDPEHRQRLLCGHVNLHDVWWRKRASDKTSATTTDTQLKQPAAGALLTALFQGVRAGLRRGGIQTIVLRKCILNQNQDGECMRNVPAGCFDCKLECNVFKGWAPERGESTWELRSQPDEQEKTALRIAKLVLDKSPELLTRSVTMCRGQRLRQSVCVADVVAGLLPEFEALFQHTKKRRRE